MAAWIKWTMDFWEAMAQMGPGVNGAEAGATNSQDEAGVADSCLAALTLWEAYFSLMSEPGTVAAVFEGIKAPSEIILKMAQAGWSGYFYLHQQLAGRPGPGKFPRRALRLREPGSGNL
ncbi:MAG: hypothetical protein NTY36_11970 [Deltaproteobacteria bacterium]|nr:hypothetical protein [Deltaproteobacteria bacterium]